MSRDHQKEEREPERKQNKGGKVCSCMPSCEGNDARKGLLVSRIHYIHKQEIEGETGVGYAGGME